MKSVYAVHLRFEDDSETFNKVVIDTDTECGILLVSSQA